MMIRMRMFAAAVALVAILSSATAGSDDPTGIWLTQAGDAKVAVSRSGHMLSGKVIWLKTPIDPATGRLQEDDKNPDPRLAKRRIVGLQLFIGMKMQSPGKWSGRIYNADDGKAYDSNIILQETSKLKVEGCVGAFCGGEIWARSTK